MPRKLNIKGCIKVDSEIGHNSLFLTYQNKEKNLEVKISPHFGSNIYSFKYNNKDIFYCDLSLLKQRDWTGCFVLWPYPNRVRDKKFEFEGEKYSLKKIKRKNGNYPLIHGLVDNKIWEIGKIQIGSNFVKAQTFIECKAGNNIYEYFPFESKLTLKFTLNEFGLRVDYKVENFSNKNLPFGFALHPYFSLLSGRNHTLVRLPAKNVMDADKELLPTGNLINVKGTHFDLNSPISVSKLSLDHVFTDLDKNHTPCIDYSDKKMKVFLDSSEDFTHMVVYTPKEEPYLCMESQTGSTDMINLHTKGVKQNNLSLQKAAHLLVLSPKHEHGGFIHYKISEQA